MNRLGRDVQVGAELFRTEIEIDRDRLVRYAGASGDFNPIHYNDAFAEQVGLPGVIAHGMLTLGLAAAALSDHLGDPADLLEVGARFTRPILVPASGSVPVTITATVRSAAPETAPDTAVIDLGVQVQGRAVLGKAQAVVRLHGG